jgi:hypothetical protein
MSPAGLISRTFVVPFMRKDGHSGNAATASMDRANEVGLGSSIA